jgi:hypothetical protein
MQAHGQQKIPSFVRTIPSTPEFHRVMRRRRSWVITTGRELEVETSSLCPEGIEYSFFMLRENFTRVYNGCQILTDFIQLSFLEAGRQSM